MGGRGGHGHPRTAPSYVPDSMTYLIILGMACRLVVSADLYEKRERLSRTVIMLITKILLKQQVKTDH